VIEGGVDFHWLTNPVETLGDEEGSAETSLCHVSAGGDAVTGAATVTLAAGAGKNAAQTIHEDLCA
jgi:NADPH-dependent glutamate synthase beta subunit-like oxidoreductase